MYKYWGFGLKIVSEIELPELLPADFTEADVKIIMGKVPSELKGEGVIKRAFSSIATEEYLLNIKNICRYYAGHGSEVILEPAAGIDERSTHLFLLGTVMAAILYQRGNIPMHASAIINKGKLVLFAGDSGAGKSTLVARLATRGYDVFTDDVCVLQHNTSMHDGVVGTASYPMIKLWEDAIAQFDNGQFNKEFKVRPQLPKYGQFFYDTFHKESLPVDKIFILSPLKNTRGVNVRKLGNLEAFRLLDKQAYRYQLISNTKIKGLHFSLLSQLVNQSAVYEVTRPEIGSDVASLIDAVTNLF